MSQTQYNPLDFTPKPAVSKWSTGAKIGVASLITLSVAAVVIFILIMTGVIQYPSATPPSSTSTSPPSSTKPPANNLMSQGENLIKEMYQATTDLASIFNQYATERLSNELLANNAYNSANTTLTDVTNAQTNSKTAYDTLKNSSTSQYTTPSSSISSNASIISGAVGSIESIISGTGIFPSTPSGSSYGSQFGNSLLQIENIKSNAYSAYNSIQGQINNVVKAVNDTQKAQKDVATYLSNAKRAYNELNNFLTTVFSSYMETTQYKNLKRSIDNATFLSKQIQDLLNSQGGSYNYSQSLRNLKINLDNSIATASSYLNNVNLLYTFLLVNDKSNVNDNVLKIAEIFTKVLNIIGTYQVGSLSSYDPVPFTTPVAIGTPPNANNTILFYYNNVITMNINAITQYNNLLTTYNQVIGNINRIQTLSDGVFSSMVTTSNAANNSLLSSQESLRPFFPGGTTPGVSTYTTQPPLPTQQIPTLTPVSLPAYTTMNVVYS